MLKAIHETCMLNAFGGSCGRVASMNRNTKSNMNTKSVLAILLIVLGVVVLTYSGLVFKTPGQPINFLGLHIETTHSHFIPPAVGALALVGGVLLLVMKPRQV